MQSTIYSTHNISLEGEPASEYSYDDHGDDWLADYPSCGESFQSPINLLNPISEYGKSYMFYDYKDDKAKLTYQPITQEIVESLSIVHSVELGYRN